MSAFKNALADVCIDRITPIGEEMQRLQDSPEYIESVFEDGGR